MLAGAFGVDHPHHAFVDFQRNAQFRKRQRIDIPILAVLGHIIHPPGQSGLGDIAGNPLSHVLRRRLSFYLLAIRGVFAEPAVWLDQDHAKVVGIEGVADHLGGAFDQGVFAGGFGAGDGHRVQRGQLAQLALGGLIQAGGLDAHRQQVGQDLQDGNRLIVKSFFLQALHIQHADHHIFDFERQGHLGAGLSQQRVGQVARVAAHIRGHAGFALFGHIPHHPALAHFQAIACLQHLLAGLAGGGFERHVLARLLARPPAALIDQEYGGMVKTEALADQVHRPVEQLVHLAGRSGISGDFGGHLQLHGALFQGAFVAARLLEGYLQSPEGQLQERRRSQEYAQAAGIGKCQGIGRPVGKFCAQELRRQ